MTCVCVCVLGGLHGQVGWHVLDSHTHIGHVPQPTVQGQWFTLKDIQYSSTQPSLTAGTCINTYPIHL